MFIKLLSIDTLFKVIVPGEPLEEDELDEELDDEELEVCWGLNPTTNGDKLVTSPPTC